MLPNEITYEEWISYVFDHPVLDPAWWWQEEDSEHYQFWDNDANPPLTLAFLTRLFEEPAELIGRFSRAQIDQGLSYLVDNSCSSTMYVLLDRTLPWENRRRCFAGMASLYENLMAPVYRDDLGHLQIGPEPDHPTYGCYMWWDVIPLYAGMEHPDQEGINQVVLEVFEKTLALKSEACLESVLHGLGHWHLYLSMRTEPIVRRFLRERTDISWQLCRYAENAAMGCVQ